MTRLPALTYRDVVGRLRELGFEFDRQAKGSHEIWRNPTTKCRTTVPRHPGALPRGTLRAVIRGTGLSVERFLGEERSGPESGDPSQ
ncbi:MAG: addiction module toxin, HicA family [Armatimonadetes bacterium CG_4_10_14_3_um_filter_66_18]|nr:MAG: addiction module toxin, HicA family [Armatimonadetes bacterium CG_4_10_14_3_um_filter_66_18]PIZ34463.1 MAG: addiction module toxin, HicA family [Armatimonadetes bacterium CG_4_10_14_0_8_um_filter_66_14]PJB60629.1 MAG: addiction module toxin, HicA family [Armatimonadetes bacterium CG_4_9_14_3_um_filter_66_14]